MPVEVDVDQGVGSGCYPDLGTFGGMGNGRADIISYGLVMT